MRVLHYLGRYLYKSPLPNSRLERFENGKVTFRFQSHRTGKTVHQTLAAIAFLHRLLLHVLPERLRHVRGYGLLAPTHAAALLRAHQWLATRDAPAEAPPTADKDSSHRCPFCHRGRMRIVARFTAQELATRIDLPPARSPP